MWTTPKTWNVGDPATSSDLNTYIRDNTNFLYGDGSWTNATLINSWSSLSEGAARFMMIGNMVVLRGIIDGGGDPSNCMVLPSGYCPSATWTGAVAAQNSSSSGPYASVAPSGGVTLNNFGGSGWVSLDSIQFPVL